MTAAPSVALSAFSIGLRDLADDHVTKLRRYDAIPAALIGRLARDVRTRGQHVGDVLLADAIGGVLPRAPRALRLSRVSTLALLLVPLDRERVSEERQPEIAQVLLDLQRAGNDWLAVEGKTLHGRVKPRAGFESP